MENKASEPKKYDDNAPWFKQPIFWMLMSGPIIVVIAAFASFGFAKTHAQELVTDDYYKDGKHINMQIDRDQHAKEKGISAQVLFNPEGTAVKVFVNGQFEQADGLTLVMLHPARQAYDRKIALSPDATGGFTATFEPLPKAVHWYVRLEDNKGVWRVENKWLPSQGGASQLTAWDLSKPVSAPNTQW